jgi:hypothetical protein
MPLYRHRTTGLLIDAVQQDTPGSLYSAVWDDHTPYAAGAWFCTVPESPHWPHGAFNVLSDADFVATFMLVPAAAAAAAVAAHAALPARVPRCYGPVPGLDPVADGRLVPLDAGETNAP